MYQMLELVRPSPPQANILLSAVARYFKDKLKDITETKTMQVFPADLDFRSFSVFIMPIFIT